MGGSFLFDGRHGRRSVFFDHGHRPRSVCTYRVPSSEALTMRSFQVVTQCTFPRCCERSTGWQCEGR